MSDEEERKANLATERAELGTTREALENALYACQRERAAFVAELRRLPDDCLRARQFCYARTANLILQELELTRQLLPFAN